MANDEKGLPAAEDSFLDIPGDVVLAMETAFRADMKKRSQKNKGKEFDPEAFEAQMQTEKGRDNMTPFGQNVTFPKAVP